LAFTGFCAATVVRHVAELWLTALNLVVALHLI
jgi:hypothetical protein